MKSVKENAILNIIYTLTNLVFPLITYPYVARVLSADGVGRVNFFTATSNFAVMFSSLGITTYGVRAIAKVRDDRDKVSKTLTELMIINLVATAIVLSGYLCLSIFNLNYSKDPLLCIVNATIILATPWGINWFYSGLEQYSYITKRTVIFKIISLILVFLIIHKEQDYIFYALILAFSSIGANICNFLYARKIVGFHGFRGLSYKQHFKPMILLFASTLAISVYTNLDTIMLGVMQGDRQVGLYTTAVKVKTILLAVVNAISTVLLPRLSYYISSGNKKEYNEEMRKSSGVIFLLTIPLTLFFIINAQETVLVLGGPDYVEAKFCIIILMPILIISGFSNIIGNQVLIPLGKDKYFMYAVVAGALGNVILNFFLIPRFGSNGAAIATLFAELLQMSIQFTHGKNIIKSNINGQSILHASFATLISGALLLISKFYISVTINYLLEVLVDAILFFAIYYIILLLVKDSTVIMIIKSVKNRAGRKNK